MPGTGWHLKDGKTGTVETFWNYTYVIVIMFPSNGGCGSQLATLWVKYQIKRNEKTGKLCCLSTEPVCKE